MCTAGPTITIFDHFRWLKSSCFTFVLSVLPHSWYNRIFPLAFGCFPYTNDSANLMNACSICQFPIPIILLSTIHCIWVCLKISYPKIQWFIIIFPLKQIHISSPCLDIFGGILELYQSFLAKYHIH